MTFMLICKKINECVGRRRDRDTEEDRGDGGGNGRWETATVDDAVSNDIHAIYINLFTVVNKMDIAE